jgi:xanthine/uracil permease
VSVWRLWRRSRLLAVAVVLLAAISVGNVIWIGLGASPSAPQLVLDGMAAGTVIGITCAAQVLKDR